MAHAASRRSIAQFLLFTLLLACTPCPGQSIQLNPADIRQSIDMMGGDMERSSFAIQNARNKAEIIQWGFGDIDFNMCRVQYDKKQELVEGVKNWSFYDGQVTSMQEIQAVNPDILFFATLRSDYDGYGNDNNLPDWICNYPTKEIDAGKYGTFLADYVEYMHQQGVPIAIMSVAKEWTTFVTAEVARDVIISLQSELDSRGVPMPLISDQGFWSTAQGNKYLDAVASLGTEDLYWSFCNHNYGTDDDTLWEGIASKSQALGKALYNDESSHGGGGPTFGEEREITTPIAAYTEKCHMYAAGVKGELFFEIWSRGINKETRPIYFQNSGTGSRMRAYYIMRHFANHVLHSRYITSEVDSMPGVHTMAFRNNDQLVVWVINEATTAYSAVPVSLAGSPPAGSVDRMVWTEDSDITGASDSLATSASGFTTDIPGQSLNCYLVNIGPPPPRTLPYAQSFEDGLEDWAQSQDDDFDWSRNTLTTSTSSSGPDSAADGHWYVYAEGHVANAPNKSAYLECLFDLSNVTGATLSFDYHMFGSYIDYLAVDVHDGTTWTTGVWIEDGPVHTASDDPWSNAEVDLSAYAGRSAVTLRFRTKKNYWHSSDAAIDNIRLVEPPQSLPYAEDFENGLGSWVQSTDDDIDWTRNSGGTATDNTGPSGTPDGDWYLFVENHDSGASYKTASVECSFDLSSALRPELSFDYHMFGYYIDCLAVDVFDGSQWNLDVWNRTGQQHSASDTPWSTALVDLSEFAGNDAVTIRFRSQQLRWHAADTAIDNISIAEAATPYQTWAASTFADAESGTDTSESGNPDGDRYTNLQEWALVLDPMTRDVPQKTASIQTTDGNTYFTVQYLRRAGSGLDVHAAWSYSTSSDDWRVHGDGMTETTLGITGDIETMSAAVPIEHGQKFIRIVISP